MSKHLALTLILVLFLILIISGCTGIQTVTQTVTQTRTNTITTPWIQTTTDTVTKIQTQTTEIKNLPILFSSSNHKITTPFIVNSSQWVLQYSTSYTGLLTIALYPYQDLLIVNNEEVIAGEVYQRVMEGYSGFPIYLEVTPNQGGDWTISIIEITD